MPEVTCRTEDCENGGVPIELGEELRPLDEDGQPVADAVWSIQCGVCEQPITTLREAGTDAG